MTKIINVIRSHLMSSNANLHLLGLRCLANIPLDFWASSEMAREGQDSWGEGEWAKIMVGLEDGDASIRKAVSMCLLLACSKLTELSSQSLRLVQLLDSKILQAHRARLLESVKSAASSSSRKSLHLDYFVSRSLEVTFVIDPIEDWIKRMKEVLIAAEQGEGAIVEPLITGFIDRFLYLQDGDQLQLGTLLIEDEATRQNLTLSLLVAATVGVGVGTDDQLSSRLTQVVSWITDSNCTLDYC